MFHIITGAIGFYVVWRFVWPLPWGRASKALLAVVLLVVAEHHLVTRSFFGSMASPEIPTAVLIALGWAFGALIILAMLLLVKDLAGALSYLFFRKLGQLLLSAPGLRYGMGVVAMVLAGVGVWEAIRVPEVKTIEIVLPRLPQEFDGFRVVQLTDLHASRLLQASWMEAVVAKTNALNADLTVITGDLADGTPEARAADMQPLKNLTARYGVFAIPGNHEYYVDYLRWLSAFNQLGLRMLLNEHVTITHDGRDLVVAGITDSTASAFGQPPPDLAAALDGASKTNPVILLSHRPTGAAANARAGVDLQLSGHTHGGQILGAHVLAQWVNEGFVSGLYQVDGMRLYVSNGTGLWNGFPIRLGRPSEITQIVLRSTQNTEAAQRAAGAHQRTATIIRPGPELTVAGERIEQPCAGAGKITHIWRHKRQIMNECSSCDLLVDGIFVMGNTKPAPWARSDERSPHRYLHQASGLTPRRMCASWADATPRPRSLDALPRRFCRVRQLVRAGVAR